MCGRIDCCHESDAETERERLERAIDRLSRRKWCDDATLALDAARKHLATLPAPAKWTLTSDYVDFHYPSYESAVEAGKAALERGASHVRIVRKGGQ
jgi:hypothetical protein